MKSKRNFFCMLLISTAIAASGQNLVLNPSFELGIDPTGLAELSDAQDWVSPTDGTPDYFRGSSIDAGVPDNCFGLGVNAQQGNCYAGFITYAVSSLYCPGIIFREYVMGRLSTQLTPFTPYHVSFWIRSANRACQSSDDDLYTDKLGVAFANSSYDELGTTFGCNIPNIALISPIFQTPAGAGNEINTNNQWIEISFNFIAPTSGLQRIVIGNFNDNANTTVSNPNNHDPNRAYYYIDNVSVTPMDCDKCVCQVDAALDHFSINTNGDAGVTLNIGIPPIMPVSKFRITLVNYHSNVQDDCRKCEVARQEEFGTINGAPTLYGTNPTYAPYSISTIPNFSREVTWCFTPAVQWGGATNIPLHLRFPPVFICCDNNVSFCFRIEFWDEDCKACDRLICYDGTGHHAEPKSLIVMPEEKPTNRIQESQKLNVIPNPATSSFTVMIPKDNLNGTLQVYDLNGALVKEAQVTSEHYTINTKAYSDGIYFIRYKTSTGSFEEKVVIKK